MSDQRKPLRPQVRKPDVLQPVLPETDAPQEVLPEGQIPGLPVSSDPLLQPMPHPRNRQVRPLD